MKSIIFVANITEHIESFHLPYMKALKDLGWRVDVAAFGNSPKADYNCFYNLNVDRSPYRLIKNTKAILQLRKIIRQNKYDIIYCHTPMGGVVGRIAAMASRRNGTKVIYCAHGFHFYKGAKLVNWILYYSAEKILAKLTDVIITINSEDYELAKLNFASSQTKVYQINGIGVNLNKFKPPAREEREYLRKKFGFNDRIVFTYLAEFIPRKNHKYIIHNAALLSKDHPQILFVFAGHGELEASMKKLSEQFDMANNIEFLGYRNDVPDLLKASDYIISASVEEGFGINLVEGLSCGLPAIASVVRGHKEMVKDGINGYFFLPEVDNDLFMKIDFLLNNVDYQSLSKNARLSVSKFTIESSLENVLAIIQKEVTV